jgi:geranylgeranyl pyrophosphate synthase
MKASKKLMEQVQILLKKRGQKAFEIAKDAILQEKNIDEHVYEALRYFIEESWYNVQHPALLSLACEAVGGDPKKTTAIGAAMVLLTGAADIHDDIIDESKIKGSKLTIFGKFGKEIALLAGDALLFKGLTFLHKACKKLPKKQSQGILNITKQAFFEIGSAEAKETILKRKYDLAPEKYCKVIEMKGAIAEATARIGAILGNGTPKQVEILGHYGRTLGVLMAIRYDFIDLFEPDELKNRLKNECLPLPLLYAFKDAQKQREILLLLEKNKITEQETWKIIDLIMETKQVRNLIKKMRFLVKDEKEQLNYIKRNRIELKLLLQSALEDL